ncbi:hypothetical protein LSH36_142g04012 [Paralvinella palmiformis]|uniref:EF-hand domain-containing protein n=2 Tax=Paralvinella palmiformis TaxID=53620 RepID=A0AAD9JWW7_9ANNE|nr:hypothetical protein LSH36_142g04012 [Paralvinella palmiformis]
MRRLLERLTMASREDYEKFFREADVDNSGTLTFEELLTILRRNGYKQSEDDLKRIFRITDTSGDGLISLDEYMAAMGQQPPTDHRKAAMRAVFVEFDQNGDGFIDKKELKEVFGQMGTIMSDDDIDRLMTLCDKDHDGLINYEEFLDRV